MVNNVGGVFSKQGASIRTFYLIAFFQVSSGYTSDPKVLYDASSQRWFASILDSPDVNHVVLAVSASNDPNGLWRIYSVAAGPGRCTDQPYIGVSDDKLVVTGNDFANHCPLTTQNTGFLGAQFWILNKLEMLAGLPSIDLVSFGPDSTTESAYPVQSLSPTSSEYMVSAGVNASFDSGATNPTSHAVQLFTVTGVPPDNVTIATLAFSTIITRPPGAAQPGTTGLLETDDARVEGAVWYQGKLWLSLTDACIPPGDSQQRSCVHLMQIDTTLLKTRQDLEFGKTGQYLYYPAVEMDNIGNLGVIYGYSSATNSTCCFPSLAVTGQVVSDPPNTLAPPRTIRQGNGVESSRRYGDYFGAARDPTDPTIIWTAGEYTIASWQTEATFIESIKLTGLTLAASPSYLLIQAGSSTTSTLTLTSIGGFAGNVSLTATISPSGPTVSLNPSSVAVASYGTQQSTITVSTASSTPAGPYNLTITANGGGGNRFLSLQVRVGPDFSISANPASMSFPAGSSATTLVTIRSLNSFAGPVSLSASVWVPGPTASFNTTTLNLTPGGTGTSKLTVSTNPSIAAGNYAVTVNSASGSINHLQTVTAGVVDFGILSTPLALNVAAGSSAVFNVTLTSIDGLAGPVQLTATASPSGPSTFLNPATVSLPARGLGNSTMTISVPAYAVGGTVYTVMVSGVDGALRHSASVTVTVAGVVCIADIYSPLPCPGSSGWSFNGPDTSPSTQLKIGVFVSNSLGFNLFAVTITSDLSKLFPVSVDTSGSVLGPTANYFYCIRGMGGTCGSQDGGDTVSVDAFSGSATPTPTTGLLFTVTYNITSITSTIPIGFQIGCGGGSVQSSSACVDVSLDGASVPETVQTASFSSLEPQQSVALSANPPTLGPVPANTGATTIITATSQNGFPEIDAGEVTFTAQSSGAGTSFNSSTVTLTPGGSRAVTLTMTGSGPGTFLATVYGTYTVTNTTTGFSNTLAATLTVSVTVTDFTIAANPTTVRFAAGLTNTSTITVTSINGFAGTITLSATSLPNGAAATFSPASVTLTAGGSATTTATIRSASAGTYSVFIRGQNSNDLRAVRVTAIVYDFTISLNPTSATIHKGYGSSTSSTVTLTSLNGFSGTITLTTQLSPRTNNAPSVSLNPTSLTVGPNGSVTATLTVSVNSSTTKGTYTVTVTATRGPISHSATFTVTITQ